MNTRLLLLGCLLAFSVQAQETKRELWMWKDANGVTQYSDRPVAGATRVELTGVTKPPSAAPAPAAVAPAGRSTVRAPAKAVVQYQALEIWQPAQDESFFGADASVTVRLRSEPDLAPGDRLVLSLDGRRVEGRTDSYEFQLANLPRGAHSLQAAIVDELDNAKITSEPRVFHVRLPTVNEPRAVGPNLRPPPPPPAPKPTPGPGK
jgi:hypothetical protein